MHEGVQGSDCMKLSVVMPAYDSARHISRAIRSCLIAMPQDSELIVINDGSSDNTLEVVRTIDDPRVKVLNQKHSGIVAALNLGVGVARGEYVARMDADDICIVWRFTKQLHFMKNNPQVDFHFSTAIAFGNPLLPIYAIPQVPLRLDAHEFLSELLQRNPAVHPSMICKRESLLALGGYLEVPAEDENLWLRAALRNMTLTRSALPTILLRLHSRQITRTESWNRAKEEDIANEALRSELRRLATPRLLVKVGHGIRSFLTKLDREGMRGIFRGWSQTG